MNPWAGRKVLVTGGTGFVGASMTRQLVKQKVEVTVLTRPGSNRWRLSDIAEHITFMEGSLLDNDFVHNSFEEVRPELTYNFAFPAGYPTREQERANMLEMGSLAVHNLLNAARNNGANRFIQIGSSTEYGLRATPHKEEDAMYPVTIRGVGKAASTLLCRQFATEFDFPVCILRLYAVYGPYEQPKRLIPRAIHATMTGKELLLTPPGIVHDWIYVDDVIDACLKAGEIDLTSGEIMNIASGEQTSNEEVVQKIQDVSGLTIRQIPSTYTPKPFDTSNWQADISKAKTLLNWTPKTSLEKGLGITLEFWKKHTDRLEI